MLASPCTLTVLRLCKQHGLEKLHALKQPRSSASTGLSQGFGFLGLGVSGLYSWGVLWWVLGSRVVCLLHVRVYQFHAGLAEKDSEIFHFPLPLLAVRMRFV